MGNNFLNINVDVLVFIVDGALYNVQYSADVVLVSHTKVLILDVTFVDL